MAVTSHGYFREALSEFFATCGVVYLSCGTGLSTRDPTDDRGLDLTAHFAVSLAAGLAVSTAIYMFGNVRCDLVFFLGDFEFVHHDMCSGAHFNPVVSVSFWAVGKLSLARVFMYSAAQFAGAIFGAALLKVIGFAC